MPLMQTRAMLLVAAGALGAAACAPPAPEPSAEARAMLDSAVAIARRHSLWRDTVSWRALERKLRVALGDAKTTADAYPAINLLTESLGDHHSYALPPDRLAILQGARATNGAPASLSALGALIREPRIAHVRVPAHTRQDIPGNRAYATAIRRAMVGMALPRPCGWIVDLRENGGGNMWPMFAGLRPLLGDDTLGAFVTLDSTWHWTADGAEDNNARTYMKELPAATLDLSAATVAVLIGPVTGSAGEALALAFRGRPNARSFGAPTRGVATSNARFALPDGGWLVLTTGVMRDRNNRGDGGPIRPDVRASDADPRAALDSAVAWLSAGCPAIRRPR